MVAFFWVRLLASCSALNGSGIITCPVIDAVFQEDGVHTADAGLSLLLSPRLAASAS